MTAQLTLNDKYRWTTVDFLPLRKFDSNQPRDEQGRWVDAQGGWEVFHGTSSAAIERIMKEGIKVMPGQRNFKDVLFYDDRGRSVFVADNLAEAAWYAKIAARQQHAEPIVLEVRVPAEVRTKFVPDEEGNDGTWRAPVNIEPSWIVGAKRPIPSTDPRFKVEWQDIPLGKAAPLYMVVDAKEWAVEKFDPNQPRDEEGKWTDTGAASGRPPGADLTKDQVRLGYYRAMLGQKLTDDQKADLLLSAMYNGPPSGSSAGGFSLRNLRDELEPVKASMSFEARQAQLDEKLRAMSDEELTAFIQAREPELLPIHTEGAPGAGGFGTIGIYELSESVTSLSAQQRVADGLIDIYNNHPDLVKPVNNRVAEAQLTLEYGTSRWDGAVMDRLANSIPLDKQGTSGLRMYSKDYDTFLPSFIQNWTTAGQTDAYVKSYAALQDFGPNVGLSFWMGKSPEEMSASARRASGLSLSRNMRANLIQLYANTQAYFQAKFPRADLSTKTLTIKRGVGGHFEAYTPAPVESWTTDAYTPARFGKLNKMMASRDGKYSILKATVPYNKILFSHDSLPAGVWPGDKNLKGKKEVVVLGGGLLGNITAERLES